MRILPAIITYSIVNFSPAFAQNTDWESEGQGAAASAVLLAATPPKVTGEKSFRVGLMLVSKIGESVSYATVYRGNEMFGWEALTAELSSCKLSYSALSNVPIKPVGRSDIIEQLAAYDGAEAYIGKSRPVFLAADFRCDEQVLPGHEVSIQTEFYFRLDQEWKKANYYFPKRVLEK